MLYDCIHVKCRPDAQSPREILALYSQQAPRRMTYGKLGDIWKLFLPKDRPDPALKAGQVAALSHAQI